MATAILGNPQLFGDDSVTYGSASALAVITKGDWLVYSGQQVTNIFVAGQHQNSAAGVALDHSPKYDELGRAINNSAIPILRRGILRVSASGSGSALTIPLGAAAYQASTASGIVGQTGATGVGPQWITAPRVGISAAIGALTATVPSGVGYVLRHPVGGDSGLGQIDVAFDVGAVFGRGYF